MISLSTIFSGGGLVEAGLPTSVRSLWGIENDPEIVRVFRDNFPQTNLIESDVKVCDFRHLEIPDWLHFSPPCMSYSRANIKGKESSEDISLAKAIVRGIENLQPQFITLENVPEYEGSQAHWIIKNTLYELGYWIEEWVINFVNFKIPQNRKRLFLTAYRYDRQLILPSQSSQVGWWQAIRDLIGDLPPTQLTNTQLRLLKKSDRWNNIEQIDGRYIYNRGAILIKRIQLRNYISAPLASEPSFTITAGLTSGGRNTSRNNFVNLLNVNGCFSLSVRGLGRLQTLPDSYRLSGINQVDGKIIGNGIPPLFIRQFVEANFS